jgi:ribosome-binding factor A
LNRIVALAADLTYIQGMSHFRMARVNAQVKKELGRLIRDRISVEEHGLITVTDAQVSKDLRTAKVFFSVVGVRDQEEVAGTLLNGMRQELQSELAKRVKLKYTPQLSFRPDHSTERGIKVIGIIEDLEKSDSDPNQ